MCRIVIIADDLTGAADTGVIFAPIAKKMHLINTAQFSAAADRNLSAVAVCTNTRSMTAAEAERTTADLSAGLKYINPTLVYKKIDSCLRGHIGIELLSLLNACGAKAAIVAPAYPRMERVTRHDLHYVNGIPLAHSEAKQDPIHPISTSSLLENLSLGHNQPVGKIDISHVQSSLGCTEENILVSAIAKELEQGKRIIGVDAVTNEDLSIIASTVVTHFPELILSGSAGLAQAAAACLKANFPYDTQNEQDISSGLQLNGKHMLFVGGSVSRVLHSQLNRLAANHGIALEILNAEEVLNGLPLERRNCLSTRLHTGSLIIYLSMPGMSQNKLPSQALALALGKLTANLVKEFPGGLGAIFASGGDTAQAILDMLDNPELLIRHELAPGLIFSTLASGPHSGLYFLTKSGSFGDAQMLSDAYEKFK